MTGAIFFVGGIMETMIVADKPDWILFFPYKLTSQVSSLLGLSLEFSGFTLLILGIILSMHYALEKALYLNQMKGAYIQEKNSEVKRFSINQKQVKSNAKQHETKDETELDDCTKYLVEERGFDKSTAKFYCKVLGGRWQELVDEES
jgi:cytochrome c biogenesis factor